MQTNHDDDVTWKVVKQAEDCLRPSTPLESQIVRSGLPKSIKDKSVAGSRQIIELKRYPGKVAYYISDESENLTNG